MEDNIRIRWSYEPIDFIEDLFEIDRGDYKIKISDGIAEASLSESTHDKSPKRVTKM